MAVEASKLTDLLYQGSLPASAQAVKRAGFDALVLCAREGQPPDHALQGIPVLRCPLDDNGRLSERHWRRAHRCALTVARLVQQRRRVLVTCMQGRNRSGLVSGIALHLLTGHPGCDCARYIQVRRPTALTNEAFVAALCTRLP
jgi:protein-tyrosine phosphatase